MLSVASNHSKVIDMMHHAMGITYPESQQVMNISYVEFLRICDDIKKHTGYKVIRAKRRKGGHVFKITGWSVDNDGEK